MAIEISYEHVGTHWVIKGIPNFATETEAQEFSSTYNSGLRADALRGQIVALNEKLIKIRELTA